MLLNTEHRPAESLAIWNFNLILSVVSSVLVLMPTDSPAHSCLRNFTVGGILHWISHQLGKLHVQHGEKRTDNSLS